VKLLEEEGADFQRVDYFVEALSRDGLARLLRKAGLAPRDALRKRDRAFKELGLDDPAVSDEGILDALARHPGLLQRPIVERGEPAVLARPVERVREFFRDGR